MLQFLLFDILRPLFYLLEPSVNYFSILTDFQNSGVNVQKLCFYLLIPSKDPLDRFAILSYHSQTSRISLGVFNIFITFCVDRWQRNMLK